MLVNSGDRDGSDQHRQQRQEKGGVCHAATPQITQLVCSEARVVLSLFFFPSFYRSFVHLAIYIFN